MNGQIVVAGGIPVQVDGESGVLFRKMPEAEAFSGWQHGQFEEIERSFAAKWRQELKALSLHDIAAYAKDYGLELSSCKTIEDARDFADRVTAGPPSNLQIMFAIDKLEVSSTLREPILQSWRAAGEPTLAELARYAHFFLRIEALFEIALATGKISADRPPPLLSVARLDPTRPRSIASSLQVSGLLKGGDITVLATQRGWPHLAVAIDIQSLLGVGYIDFGRTCPRTLWRRPSPMPGPASPTTETDLSSGA